jgi:hypothetical protein
MANVIKCPSCGKNNPSDLEFCQYCQTRLQPLTGNLKGEDKPLTPGQAPTKKITADLEPVLPQWLREARNSARQAPQEDTPQTPQAPRSTSSSSADLLAGLRAQRQTQDDEEEDTPDWLANITGETPKPKKPKAESSEVRWVELGDKKDFAQSTPEPEPDDLPSWLSEINQPTPPAGEKDELTDWLRSEDASRNPQQPPQPFSFDNPPAASGTDETPDWLHSMVADDSAGFNDSENAADESFTSSDTPDWLRALDAENAAPKPSQPSSSSDTPDWLRALDAENAAPKPSQPSSSSDTPDWLRALDAENAAPKASQPLSSSDTPDWLRALDTESAAPKASEPSSSSDLSSWLSTMDEQDKAKSAASAAFSGSDLGEMDEAFSSVADTPDWLKGLDSGASSSDQDWLKSLQPAESEQPEQDSTPAWLSEPALPVEKSGQEQPGAKDDADLDIPSWLKASAPQSSIFEPSAAQEEPAPASSSSDMPDWLNTFKSVDTPESQPEPAVSTGKPVDDAQPSSDAESLFTELPDWLSVVDETTSPESMPAPITNVDAIAPGDLPSWVQAMRPVDAGIPQISTSLSGDRTPESRGALAGLQGVLPAGKGFNPTSKPKAYSIKLQASEEQQAHAALLEQILAAETAPVPLDAFSRIGTSRALRWLLFVLLPVLLTVVLSMRTQIFALPNSMLVPLEFSGALQAAQSIPEGAPVLVVFDYQSARVGEIEAAAVPMFDQMILLRHPRLTFVSTNETGAVLAERFISSGSLAGHNYKSGDQYVNLGYLPGGQMGIRAFAENPSTTAQYTVPQSLDLMNFNPTLAWTLPPLAGVTSLSNFAAWVLITDDADSARTWIEQTASARQAVPFVVVSSAQAAPMIQPYYASQQISGLVSGLYGGALFEQNNSGRPGTVRTYWDAYSIGMLLAMVLILGGGLLNLALGLRDRAAMREVN